jgi:hypothetical protein
LAPHADSPVPLEVQAGVGLEPSRFDLPVWRSVRVSPGLALNSGVRTLPSLYNMRDRSGWVSEPGPSGSSRPSWPARARAFHAGLVPDAARTEAQPLDPSAIDQNRDGRTATSRQPRISEPTRT